MMCISSSLILTADTEIDTDGLFRMEHTCYNTHHYDRCREMCMKDPVHTIHLLQYLGNQLHQTKMNLGEERFKNVMATVDESVVCNLNEFNMNIESNKKNNEFGTQHVS